MGVLLSAGKRVGVVCLWWWLWTILHLSGPWTNFVLRQGAGPLLILTGGARRLLGLCCLLLLTDDPRLVPNVLQLKF